MHPRPFFWGVTLLLGSPAAAQDAISYSGAPSAVHGRSIPNLTFHVGESGHLNARVACGDQVFELDRNVGAGADVPLELKVAKGSYECQASLKLTTAGGDAVMEWKQTIASLDPIEWTWSKADVDLEKRTLAGHASRPLETARVDVYGVSGTIVDTARADLSDPKQPTFEWTTSEEVVKLVIVAADPFTFQSALELVPWQYDIPHTDVVFDSGQHQVLPVEAPKLESTWTDVTAAIAKYGTVVDIKLYVVGHTDSVGNAASNQALSERRARAIAQWYRNRGFNREIFYVGFGEHGQAVKTEDEVDEQRNRRAQYVLAANPPTSAGVAVPGWKRL